MKPPTLHFSLPGLLTALAVSLLISCSEKPEEIVPVSVPEETAGVLTPPIVTEAPVSGELAEEKEMHHFPKQASANARVASTGVTDFVDFDDQMALSIIPDQAAYMFAEAPFYIQQVGSAWVHVKENNSGNYKPEFKSNYEHYHLNYQNFIPCLRNNGQFGKPHGGGCASITPVNEPRILQTHYTNQWIKIYAYDYNSSSRVFDLLGIKVTKGPLQLWYKKHDGGWHKWSSVGVGTWNLSAHSTGITQVLISGTGNGTVAFDDVKVKMPHY